MIFRPPRTRSTAAHYDESDGLGVFANFRLVQEAFDEPERARERRYRTLLKTYLTDDSVSPVPLVRLAERDERRSDAVFRRLTGRAGFRWSADGEGLLRQHKPRWYARPRLPRIVVVGDRLAQYVSG